MAHKPKSRRPNKTGRSIGESQHVRLYRWETTCPAYRSLSIGARALLIELKSLYNGNNNGGLFMSVREAAKRLNRPTGKSQAAVWFAELQEKGFIRPNVVGGFNVKSTAAAQRATSWILTEFPFGNALATKDFMRWPLVARKEIRGPAYGTVGPVGRTVTPFPAPKQACLVRPAGPVAPPRGDSRSGRQDTDSLPGEVA